ncbi:hypothetical protein [Tolypothrix sp. VBCCA 56010]|uniref:hypothetical protein n=1 Tax=Tolypothrix sp. VBCCA 56010 TaxID=3137731 RepID=UPI003D7E0E5F
MGRQGDKERGDGETPWRSRERIILIVPLSPCPPCPPCPPLSPSPPLPTQNR